MFKDCHTLVELTLRARELRKERVDVASINKEMNIRRQEIIRTTKVDIKTLRRFPPKNDIPELPMTSLPVQMADLSAPYVVLENGVLII
jgi:hypothetical protein